jgi:hypothetical protein
MKARTPLSLEKPIFQTSRPVLAFALAHHSLFQEQPWVIALPLGGRPLPRAANAARDALRAQRYERTVSIMEKERFDLKLTYERVTGYKVPIRGYTRTGNILVLCPVHLENHASCGLNLRKGLWKCYRCDAGGDAITMVILSGTVKGGDRKELVRKAAEWLRGNNPNAIYGTKEMPLATKGTNRRVVHRTAHFVFPYVDEDNEILSEVIRIEGANADGERDKDIFRRRPLPKPGEWREERDRYVYRDTRGASVPTSDTDPTPISLPVCDFYGKRMRRPGGSYIYRMDGVRNVLYRLPEVLATARAHGRIIVTEGEKKCDALRTRTGWTVTTSAGGALKPMEPEWLTSVEGASQLVYMADADEPGRQSSFARALEFSRVVPDVRIVIFANDDSGYDVEDYLRANTQLDADQTRAALEAMIAAGTPLSAILPALPSSAS